MHQGAASVTGRVAVRELAAAVVVRLDDPAPDLLIRSRNGRGRRRPSDQRQHCGAKPDPSNHLRASGSCLRR